MIKNYCKSVTCKNFEIWLKDVHNKKKNLISIRKMFEHRIKNKSDLILDMHCIRHKFAIL